MSEQILTRIQEFWEPISKKFCEAPTAKHMTYRQHVFDTLCADVVVLAHGLGMTIHTFFPMILSGCEPALLTFLQKRAPQE